MALACSSMIHTFEVVAKMEDLGVTLPLQELEKVASNGWA